jgi:hypothetical protein
MRGAPPVRQDEEGRRVLSEETAVGPFAGTPPGHAAETR